MVFSRNKFRKDLRIGGSRGRVLGGWFVLRRGPYMEGCAHSDITANHETGERWSGNERNLGCFTLRAWWIGSVGRSLLSLPCRPWRGVCDRNLAESSESLAQS